MKHLRQHKYGAKKTQVDGIMFASKKEAKRYVELSFLQGIGKIKDLTLQPVFIMWVEGVKICKYIPDFEYFEEGIHIVEDVKGFKTPEYKLKAKLFKALYPKYKFLET